MNMILNTDSYKTSHFRQYPESAEHVSSYIESRGGKWDKTVFFGLQMFLKQYMRPITMDDVDEAEVIFTNHGVPFNRPGWMRIVRDHGGNFPLEIQAIPEGTVVPNQNVLVQVHNTDPELPWLTSYVETALLRAVWYPTTVATQSWHIKQIIREYMENTSDSTDGLEFKLHDFGARGVSSEESAGIGGLSHLVNFRGTDTVSAILYGRRFYSENMGGFSIPASEHSTMTCWGGEKGEIKAMRNMLDQFGGKGPLLACVSDSYDVFRACREYWGDALRDEVINSGSTLIIRPDSGDPTLVPVEIMEILGEKFGHRENTKGYKVLPNYIRVIQGDGVDETSIRQLLYNMKARGWSTDNIAFGMGGALLQGHTRDTLRFAMKASAIKINGRWNDVFKDPVTDSGKRSKRGRQALVRNPTGFYESIREDELTKYGDNELRTVWKNGDLLVSDSFFEIRERSEG